LTGKKDLANKSNIKSIADYMCSRFGIFSYKSVLYNQYRDKIRRKKSKKKIFLLKVNVQQISW